MDGAKDIVEEYEAAMLDHYRAVLPETCPYTVADIHDPARDA